MAEIKIHYGPYRRFGIIKHRPQRLYGAEKRLVELGYKVELVPSQYINKLSVEMKGKQIFCCDINQLQFNIECSEDLVCQKLITAVEEAKKWMYSPENTPPYKSSASEDVAAMGSLKEVNDTERILSSDVLISLEVESVNGKKVKITF